MLALVIIAMIATFRAENQREGRKTMYPLYQLPSYFHLLIIIFLLFMTVSAFLYLVIGFHKYDRFVPFALHRHSPREGILAKGCTAFVSYAR